MQKINIENHSFGFGLWLIGWMFAIGYLHLSFREGVLAFFIWPYNLGFYFSLSGF